MFFPSVKFFITLKRLIALAIFFGIAVIILFAALLLITRKKSFLVDYIPKDAAFWYWQKKDGYDAQISLALKFLGMDQKLRDVLEQSAGEIILYQKDGEWRRLSKKEDLPRDEPESYLWRTGFLFSDEEDGIGFMEPSYFNARFSDALPYDIADAYYFALQKSEQGVSFTLVPKARATEQARNIDFTSLLKYEGEQDIALAFQSEEAKFTSAVVKSIKENIRSSLAFSYPVIIEKQLADGTTSLEKAAKPELFSFEEVEKSLYRAVVDTESAKAAGVLEQLENVNPDIWYFDDGSRAAIGFSKQAVAGFAASSVVPKNFKYLAIWDQRIPLVDILGKSDALRVLQESQIKSIIIGEDGSGYIKGKMRF